MKVQSGSNASGAGNGNNSRNASGAGGTSDDNNSDDGGTGGGDGDDGGEGGDGGDQGGREPVAWDNHQRALSDVHRFKTKAKTLETTVGDLQRQIDELKSKANTGSGGDTDFKAVAERLKNELEDERKKTTGLKSSVLYNERYRAVLPELQKAGLRNDALSLLEKESLEDIEIEATTNGRFLCHGVESYVDDFRKKYPFAFQQKKVGGVNSGGGGGSGQGGQKWTPESLFKLEQQCKAKKDMAPYHAAVSEYQKQKTQTRSS